MTMPSTAIDRGGAKDEGARPVRVRRGRPFESALAGAALCAIVAVITVSGSTSEYVWLEAVARVTTVGATIAVGLYAWQLSAFRHFATLLVATGVVIFLATLAEASSPEIHALGRIFGWAAEPLLIYLILAFPSGRLRSRVDRVLLVIVVLLAVTLFLPTALLVERYPEPSSWTSCHGGCPNNPFMLVSSEPRAIEEFVRPLRELLLIVVFCAVTARVALRIRGASHLMRRILTPVLGVAILRLASFAGLIGLRRVAPESALLSAWIWLLPLGVPLLAVAFLVGLVRWRLFIASAVQRLTTRLAAHPRPGNLRGALAETFDDPSLEIIYWRDDQTGWADSRGRAAPAPKGGSARSITEIRDGDHSIAAIVHDEALRDEPAFIDAATAYAVMTLNNQRLGAEAADLLAELQDTRARIHATADEERRRLERDLHDGAQQRLIALGIKLELAAQRIEGTDGADQFRRLNRELDEAIGEMRSLARGIYPASLADWGLVEALRSAATHTTLPTTMYATAPRDRYPPAIEHAAYFCCLEALQNADKHADGATVVVIEITDNGLLRFEVRDDGAGFDPGTAPTGVGLSSMRDRLTAVAGELTIVSAPGNGTRVIGHIPLEDRPAPRATGSHSPESASHDAKHFASET
jgi:signal transduction histidine kinase